jgi:hypothetical protein
MRDPEIRRMQLKNYGEAMKRDPGNIVVNTVAKERLETLAASSATPALR